LVAIRLFAMSAFRETWRDEFLAAFHFLTRLRLDGAREDAPAPSLADAAWAFPFVGLAVGAIGGITYAIASAFALPPLASALIAIIATVIATGGLHEDGLADTADGFGGGATREDKLAIMRDSRSGAYGVMALIFSVGLRTAALAALATRWQVFGALIAVHALSRGVLPMAMRQLAPARDDGLGAAAGQPEASAAAIAGGAALVIALIGMGFRAGLSAALAAALATAAVAAIARRQIGGQTGDVFGAIEQCAETAALLAAAAWS
jgi:adenosylcobinamide-GDP ribazoletransferase